MKIAFLVLLIIAILIYSWKFYQWIKGSILFFTKPDSPLLKTVIELGITKWPYIIGGIEHIIILTVLVAALFIIFL